MAFSAFPPGSVVARFEVRQEVGRGGAGVVLRAWDPQLGREVAVKLLAPERVLDPVAKGRFQREAMAASRLKHPHLAQVFELGETCGQPFLVMEWISGKSLQALLRERGTLPYAEALELTRQVAEGLDFAHAHDVVHRDVKTANIMVGEKGEAILVDFGLASLASAQSMTETGAILGTPLYMSPEQINGEVAGPASDLYSLALVFYELVTGVPPFQGDSVWAGFHLKLNAPPPPISKVQGLDARHDAVIARALALDPAARFPDGKSLVQALEHPPTPPAHRARRSWELLLLPGLVLVPLLWPRAPEPSRPTPTPRAQVTPSVAPALAATVTPQWVKRCPPLAGLVSDGRRLALATQDGELRGWDSHDGRELWRVKLPGKPSGVPALVAPSSVVLAGPSYLRAYDVKTGALQWEHPQGASSVVVGAGGNLYVVRADEVACYSPEGESLGAKPAPHTTLPPVTSEGTLYLAGERTVTAVSLTSGKLEWQAEVSRPRALALDGNAGVLVVAGDDRLRGFSVERGSQSWEVPLPARPVGLVTGAGKVVVACADGQLQVFDGHGQLQWGARPEAQLIAGPGLAGTTVLVAGERGLHLYDALGKETLAAPVPPASLPPVAQAPLVFLPGASSLAAVPFRP